MKRIIILIILLYPALQIYSKDNSSVLFHYNNIPKSIFPYRKFTLKKMDSKWLASDISLNIEFEPIIDIKNGYMRIKLPGGDSGMVKIHELVIFLNSKKEVIVAVNVSEGDQFGVWDNIKFYRYQSGKYIKMENVIPEVDKNLFFKDPILFKKMESNKFDFGEYYPDFDLFDCNYTLPRYGTTLEVQLSTGHIENALAGNYGALDQQTENILQAYLKNIKREIIYLKWNRKESKFHVDINK